MIGGEWIRTPLPNDWRTARLRDHVRITNGYPFDSKQFSDSDGMPLVRIRDIFSREAEVFFSGEPIPEAIIESGDILVGMDGDFNAAMWKGGRALLNQRVCRLEPETTVDRRFLLYLLPAPLRLINEFTYSTTVKHLSSFDIQKIHFPFPDIATQTAIADYLDNETADIDALIAAKQKLLDLMAEKRRAIVAEAVMRGLAPSAPLRPSSIDWLGEIPTHWKVVPLRFLVSFTGGATPDTRNLEYWTGTIPWVSPKDMKRDFIDDAEDHVSEAALENSALKMIEPSAILIVVRGMILAHSFPTAINTVPVTINQDMKALRCAEKITPAFLMAVLKGAKDYLVSLADSSAHGTKKLESETLGRFEVPLPPLDEQRQIVEHISTETAKIDRLRTATENSIALLKERRAALIAAAVTGQLEIPEAA